MLPSSRSESLDAFSSDIFAKSRSAAFKQTTKTRLGSFLQSQNSRILEMRVGLTKAHDEVSVALEVAPSELAACPFALQGRARTEGRSHHKPWCSSREKITGDDLTERGPVQKGNIYVYILKKNRILCVFANVSNILTTARY